MKRLFIYPAIALLIVIATQPVFAETGKTFKTKYTTVHYQDEKDMNDFLWRLSGNRLELPQDISMASNGIDMVVERVKTILGMWVARLNMNIYLHRKPLNENKAAYYDNKTGAIHVYIENASDGVFAHEVAHAVINKYFVSPPPSQVQEILTRYVDKYLWNDY